MVHLFCDCEKVTPIWHDLLGIINQNSNSIINVTNFDEKNGWYLQWQICFLLIFAYDIPYLYLQV